MKPLLLALCGLLPLLLIACASTTRASEVLDVLKQQQDAWNRGDIEGFVRLGYWNSPDLTFFSGGDVTRGYDGLIERYTARYTSPDAEMGTLAFTDTEVIELDPDSAVVRGKWALERERLEDLWGLFTLLLRKTSEGWRIVHDHTSVPERVESEEP